MKQFQMSPPKHLVYKTFSPQGPVVLVLVYLYDVAVGVFRISTDSDTEERLSSVRTRNHLQNLHKVLLLPGTRHVPAPDLQTQTAQVFIIYSLQRQSENSKPVC